MSLGVGCESVTYFSSSRRYLTDLPRYQLWDLYPLSGCCFLWIFL